MSVTNAINHHNGWRKNLAEVLFRPGIGGVNNETQSRSNFWNDSEPSLT